MKREQDPFVERIRQLEEHLFAKELGGKEARVQSEREFWHFRPSHHAATGMLTANDVALLSEPGRRLLSVGAHPAFLERLLPELGISPDNILLADRDPAILASAGKISTVTFDACDVWPDIGTFDRIIFPESLCIALSDRSNAAKGRGAKDELEVQLLVSILGQALKRLRPNGVIRANGPMSHPNVVRAAMNTLAKEGFAFVSDYARFFLSLRNEG